MLLGDAGVGKTALVSQFMTSEYMNTYDASLGESFIPNLHEHSRILPNFLPAFFVLYYTFLPVYAIPVPNFTVVRRFPEIIKIFLNPLFVVFIQFF